MGAPLCGGSVAVHIGPAIPVEEEFRQQAGTSHFHAVHSIRSRIWGCHEILQHVHREQGSVLHGPSSNVRETSHCSPGTRS